MKYFLGLAILISLAGCASVPNDYCTGYKIEQNFAGARSVCNEWSIGRMRELTRPELPKLRSTM